MNTVNEPNENSSWGGPWTEKKLNAFVKYVKAYLTIMNKYPKYKTIYFDGFAGSGERGAPSNQGLFQLLQITEEEETVYEGAAERLIKFDEPYSFDYYYFIEKNRNNLAKLRERLAELPNAQGRILEFRVGDCNEQILKLSQALKNSTLAALVFLDPFGMQVNWSSIAALKDAHCDIWILLPTGVIVNRLLDKKAELKNIKKLESFFGLSEAEIREKFYVKTTHYGLFEEGLVEQFTKISSPIERIAALYIDNLATIWKYVTPQPLVLKNSKGAPIFHLVFASNVPAAVKIANQIIEKG
ncbi:MAG: three-Cys-motif partner protein TcmP [Saprospiraceae bacterium]